LEKKPLDYFHPQCRLMKEKGSEKRRGTDGNSKLASAVGRDAVLEKLQVSKADLVILFNSSLSSHSNDVHSMNFFCRKNYPC
jgi:hypothetical protein